MSEEKHLIKTIRYSLNIICLILPVIGLSWIFLLNPLPQEGNQSVDVAPKKSLAASSVIEHGLWHAPDSTQIALSPDRELIAYGRELISHTSVYLGPKGIVKSISNGMNCQNCHLKSGTKPFGNNYAAVAATYPKFRARSGTIESVEKRVNDCIERSLNGQRLDEQGKEMKAFVAYITWVGKDVEKGLVPKGTGILDLKPLNRMADRGKGEQVYKLHCQLCHGPTGAGLKKENGMEWKYPPLCGDESYNIGAGLYRLSRFAGFVKANMPLGTSFENPVLTDEEAWDVAAYINSLRRPSKDISKDWPDISKKPFDHPFGPYADNFSETAHKYGPFEPIKAHYKKN
jgi:thiosulfate dehydrogenase